MRGLGVRQRRMLTDMATFGRGHWPERWTMRSDDRSVLESLHRKGLVTSTGRFASLTRDGEVAASFLHGDRSARVSPEPLHADGQAAL